MLPEKQCECSNLLGSHDLQTPLRNIIRQAQWLIDQSGTDLSDDMRATVSHLAKSAARLQAVVDGMNALSKNESDNKQICKRTVDLNAALDDAILHLHDFIEETGATIERHKLPLLPLNRQQTVRLFQRIISSGLQSRGPRVPRIKIEAYQLNNGWEIIFEDNGIGITQRDEEELFSMVQSLQMSSRYPLSDAETMVCKYIADILTVRIKIESSPGRGSRFVLRFKLAA